MFETIMCLTDELDCKDWNDWDITEKDLIKMLHECFDDDEEIKVFRWNIDEQSVDDIIINPPATIVKWDDGTKTVVRCQPNDEYDAEKGIALCFMKKMCGNKSAYNEILKTAIEKYEKQQKKKH